MIKHVYKLLIQKKKGWKVEFNEKITLNNKMRKDNVTWYKMYAQDENVHVITRDKDQVIEKSLITL